jgi:hypothetical protein
MAHTPAAPVVSAAPAAPVASADRPSAAESAATVRRFVEAAARSAGPRGGDLFALPNKYRYIIEGSYIKRTAASLPVAGGGEKVIYGHGNHHGTAWDYDLRIPLLIWGPSYAKAGVVSQEAATQQDIVPTIARVIGAVPPEDVGGRVLASALKPAAKTGGGATGSGGAPKAVLVLVFDQGGRSILDSHPDAWPYMKALRAQGTWFDQARVTHIDPETIVGHVAIGTGAYPAKNGVSANRPWIRQAGVARMAIVGEKGPTPATIESPTLADVWLRQTGGKAIVIGQSLADRAAMGMTGHGAFYVKDAKTAGYKPICHWYDEGAGRWSTNADAFVQPAYVAGTSPEPYWQKVQQNGGWRGHDIYNKVDFKMSPFSAQMDGDVMMQILEREAVGQDETPDLIFWSLKATDYTAHRYGLETMEGREAVAAVDAQAKRAIEFLKRKVGEDRLMVVWTADHGGGPLPELHAGGRLGEEALVEMVNKRFDKLDNGVPLMLHVTSTQIYLDDAEARANGVKPEQVRDWLRGLKIDGTPFFAAVYTRAEVQALAAKWAGK